MVNLPLIARSWESYPQLPETASARGALFVNSLLFEAKFFTLFSFLYGIASNMQVYPVSLGYVLLCNWPGAVAMICLGYFAERRHWLANIRLTAFSSLLALAGIVFHGYGFGLYSKLNYDGLLLMPKGIYLTGIGFSLLWLRYFSTAHSSGSCASLALAADAHTKNGLSRLFGNRVDVFIAREQHHHAAFRNVTEIGDKLLGVL